MKHYQFLSVEHACRKYGPRRHDHAELQAGMHGGPDGWREQYDGWLFPLPPAAELKLCGSDHELDATAPRTQHYLAEVLKRQPTGSFA